MAFIALMLRISKFLPVQKVQHITLDCGQRKSKSLDSTTLDHLKNTLTQTVSWVCAKTSSYPMKHADQSDRLHTLEEMVIFPLVQTVQCGHMR